jgi:hypothetical protein
MKNTHIHILSFATIKVWVKKKAISQVAIFQNAQLIFSDK